MIEYHINNKIDAISIINNDENLPIEKTLIDECHIHKWKAINAKFGKIPTLMCLNCGLIEEPQDSSD